MMYRWGSVFAFVLSLFIGRTDAQEIPDRPEPPRLVNDFAALLSSDDADLLERKLVTYDSNTSTQISIVTVADIGNYDVSDFAFKLGEKWGIGRKQKDNGVLILVTLKPRHVFIATGYGVEEALPDVVCKRITRDVIAPRFKASDFYGGLNEGTDAIIQRLEGRFQNDEPIVNKGISAGTLLVILIIVLVLIIIFSSPGGGGTYSGRGFRRTPPVFGWGGFGGGHGGGGRSGGWSSGSGGFGGFGGGRFGGGGAGSSW